MKLSLLATMALAGFTAALPAEHAEIEAADASCSGPYARCTNGTCEVWVCIQIGCDWVPTNTKC